MSPRATRPRDAVRASIGRLLGLRSNQILYGLLVLGLLAGCSEGPTDTSAPTPDRTVYAAGSDGTLLHYDGREWSALASFTSGTLEALWGTGADDLFAVERTAVWHFDGEGWTRTRGIDVLGEDFVGLRSVGGISSSQVVAAGYWNNVLRYDGVDWNRAQALPEGTRTFHEVWGTPSGELVLVGSEGAVWRSDGASWEDLSVGGDVAADLVQELWAVWGDAPDRLFAAGWGSEGGIVLRWDGVSWTRMSLPSPGLPSLEAIWGVGPDELFAVGGEGTALHFDGTGWRTMSTPNQEILMDLWGTAPDDVFAVGHRGTLLHYDGAQWRSMASPTTEILWTVWGAYDPNG